MPQRRSAHRAAAPNLDDTDDITKAFKERLGELPKLIKDAHHRMRVRFPEVKSEADFLNMLPQFVIADEDNEEIGVWTQEDEDEMQRKWRRSSLRTYIQGTTPTACKVLKAVWKKSLRFFRCAPYDLVSKEHYLTFPSVDIGGKVYPDLMWGDHYSKAMINIMLNPYSNCHRGAFATILQYAVICRTNDQRKWPLKNYTSDGFFLVFKREVDKSAGDMPIVSLHDQVEAKMVAVVPSPWSKLFRAIEKVAFKPKTKAIRGPEVPMYEVRAKDLTNVERALDSLGPLDVPPAASQTMESAVMKATKSNNDWPIKHEALLSGITLFTLSHLRRARQADKRAKLGLSDSDSSPDNEMSSQGPRNPGVSDEEGYEDDEMFIPDSQDADKGEGDPEEEDQVEPESRGHSQKLLGLSDDEDEEDEETVVKTSRGHRREIYTLSSDEDEAEQTGVQYFGDVDDHIPDEDEGMDSEDMVDAESSGQRKGNPDLDDEIVDDGDVEVVAQSLRDEDVPKDSLTSPWGGSIRSFYGAATPQAHISDDESDFHPSNIHADALVDRRRRVSEETSDHLRSTSQILEGDGFVPDESPTQMMSSTSPDYHIRSHDSRDTQEDPEFSVPSQDVLWQTGLKAVVPDTAKRVTCIEDVPARMRVVISGIDFTGAADPEESSGPGKARALFSHV